jgi:hypothetical protein
MQFFVHPGVKIAYVRMVRRGLDPPRAQESKEGIIMMGADAGCLLAAVREIVDIFPEIGSFSLLDDYAVGFQEGGESRRKEAEFAIENRHKMPDILLSTCLATACYERVGKHKNDFTRGYDDACQFTANVARAALLTYFVSHDFSLPVPEPSFDAEHLRGIARWHFYRRAQLSRMAASVSELASGQRSRYVLDSSSRLH